MSSDGMEHLASVHNNPFIRQFGLPHHSAAARGETADSEPSIPSSASSDRGDDDTEQEYHVNSGFVNKLRSKFAQLENKSTKVTLSRKSASVENLLSLSSNSSSKIPPWQRDDTSLTSNTSKVDFRKPAGYKPQIRSRPRSFDLENKDSEKSVSTRKKEIQNLKQNNVIRSVKPPLPKKTSVDPSKKKLIYSRNASSDTIIPKLEHHDWKVAPDLEKIGRDNIVIIESNECSVPANKEKVKKVKDTNEDSPDGFKGVKPLTEKEPVHDENELPKPNTVSQFRTLFEKTNKARDTLNVWRHNSPPRKSSGSDTNSPSVTSPVSTPRSPLAKMNNDNVFDDISKISSIKEQEKLNSPRNSSNLDTNVSSPRDSSSLTDIEQNVDTTSTSLQKSLEMFRRRGSEDMGRKPDTNRNSYSEKEKDTNSARPLSPSVQHSLTPVHPMSKVFDSKSMSKKTEKPKRPKPVIVTKKNHPIPKDTLELKHEADRRKQQEFEREQKRESLTLEDVKEVTENAASEKASDEPKIVLTSDTSGKISPRKTQIFDSSNIVKKKRETPKIPHKSNKDLADKTMSNNVPKTISIEIKDMEDTNNRNENEVAMEISPVKPVNNDKKGKGGLTEIKPNIIETVDKPKPRKFKVKEQNFIKAENAKEVEKSKQVMKNSEEKSESPVTGMSSFLASRLKKTQPDQENQLKTSSVHLANGSSPSPVPRKRQAPERPISNGPSMDIVMESEKSAPPLPATPEPPLQKTNFDDVLNRKKKTAQPATKMVFDSSKIATKRKDPPKRKPPRKTVEQLNQTDKTESNFSVPKLDLTSITGDNQETEYQEGYIPTIIQPCSYKFIGAEVTFAKTPFKKTAKVKKVKISFDDHATTTFEYEGEESALETYLEDHPDEKEAVEKGGVVNGVAENTPMMNDVPAVPLEPETHMKSNTVIGTSGGGLTSYKSKIQTQDFQFGMRSEPEETYSIPGPDPEDEPENIDLLPADDNELDAFSAETDKPDMLF